MAQGVARGVIESGGEARLRTVPELVPLAVLAGAARRLRARQQQRDVVMGTLADLENIDGIILGSSSRFGDLGAPLRVFLEPTGALWKKGAWVGKPAGVFFTTATTYGSQETTLIAIMLTWRHLRGGDCGWGLFRAGIDEHHPGRAAVRTNRRGWFALGPATHRGGPGDG